MLRHHLDHHARPQNLMRVAHRAMFCFLGAACVVSSDSSAICDARLTGWDQPRISRRDGAKRVPNGYSGRLASHLSRR